MIKNDNRVDRAVDHPNGSLAGLGTVTDLPASGGSPRGTENRLHALDTARGLALLLGIVLHATMSFFLGVPAQDSSQSEVLGVVFYGIHTFRMCLFYLIAGLFAHLVFHRRGARAFAKDRAKRILVPMAVGWILLAPPTIAAVAWGFSRTFPEAAEASAQTPAGFPLIHFWFLYYLCIFYVLTLTLRASLGTLIDPKGALRQRLDAWVGAAIANRLAPLLVAAPTFAVLYLDPTWQVWFGVSSPDVGLVPTASAMIAFGSAFGFGWVLHRQKAPLQVFERQWRANLTLGVGLTAACLAIVGPTPNASDLTGIEGGMQMRLAYAACYAVSIWFWTFGLLGAAVRYGSAESAVRRYLADASYWLYLAHLPIIFALQVLAMDVPLPWTVKFPAIVAIGLALLLTSYHFLVRPTLIGEVLNGRRYPSRQRKVGPAAEHRVHREGFTPPCGEADTESVAALVNVSKRYGKTLALDGLSLVARPGEVLAVLGPNGAGKSTAIGLWLGTLEPDEGVATVMGGAPPEVQSRLSTGVMMQEVTLAPMLDTREHIALTASYYPDPLSPAEALRITGTQALADRRYGQLSAGQKRQVQFATAICGRPRLLLLDEPTVGLDVQAREAMWQTIRRLRDEGCAVVLTTHYLEEAEALADRVVVMAKGKKIAEGSVHEMRELVTCRRIRCASGLEVEDIGRWPGVVTAIREAGFVHVTASEAEAVVRRLLQADQSLSQLEVKQANLAEAFTELTKEAA